MGWLIPHLLDHGGDHETVNGFTVKFPCARGPLAYIYSCDEESPKLWEE